MEKFVFNWNEVIKGKRLCLRVVFKLGEFYPIRKIVMENLVEPTDEEMKPFVSFKDFNKKLLNDYEEHIF